MKMELPDKKYKTIYADPPWNYGKLKHRKRFGGRGGQAQMHYPTMGIDEIKSLPVDDITEDNAHIYLWVTNPKLRLGFEILDAWAFQYQTTITWVKIRKDGKVDRGGLGFYFRGATEHILFGTKGKLSILPSKRVPNVICCMRQGHSVKPIEMYKIIESVSPPPYIELFARDRVEGWDAWGNELGKTIQKVI